MECCRCGPGMWRRPLETAVEFGVWGGRNDRSASAPRLAQAKSRGRVLGRVSSPEQRQPPQRQSSTQAQRIAAYVDFAARGGGSPVGDLIGRWARSRLRFRKRFERQRRTPTISPPGGWRAGVKPRPQADLPAGSSPGRRGEQHRCGANASGSFFFGSSAASTGLGRVQVARNRVACDSESVRPAACVPARADRRRRTPSLRAVGLGGR